MLAGEDCEIEKYGEKARLQRTAWIRNRFSKCLSGGGDVEWWGDA
jgi:hypothetical protein